MCLMKDQWVECGNGEKITKQEFHKDYELR